MVDQISQILNWAVPVLLLLIVVGFVYTKFLSPWVMPMLVKLWDYMRGNQEEKLPKIKEVDYDVF